MPCPDLGRALHAVVYTERNTVTGDELRAFCADNLSKPKVPKGFSFVNEHLRGEDGKVRRAQVTAWVNEKLAGGGGGAPPAASGASALAPSPPQSMASSGAPTAIAAAARPAKLKYAGRVAIVTGAGNGLGKEYAKLLASRGAKVLVNDLGASLKGEGVSGSLADATVTEIKAAGGEAAANYESVVEGAKIVQAAIAAFGRVDIVVNNAGILRDVSFRKMSDDDWDKVYQVHLKGAFAVTHAAWPHMEKQTYGRIVNITSTTGLYGSFGQANYAAMKSAMLGFTFTLALEGKKRNIRANAIAPLAASRMLETVRSKEELQKLPMNTMANLVGYLCHEECKSSGGIFELGGHWISRLGWRRSRGSRFAAGFSVEDVAEKFDEIGNFETGTEFPDSDASGEAHSMEPPLVAKL